MRIKILFLLVGLFLPIICDAQKCCAGIFNTAEDYQRGNISLIADTSQCKSIRIDDFFLRPYLYIKTGNGKQKISKKDIFAVRMPDKKVYRIVNNNNFLILDTSNICIYMKEKEVIVSKRTVHSTHYEHNKVNEYYFSSSIRDSIQILNIINVRLALLKDKQFDDNLNSHFKTNESLYIKGKSGQFEINIFLNSIKN